MTKILPFPAHRRADGFTAKKLEWIEAVALDVTIPAEAARLATLLALKFLSRRSGNAFPSQITIGELMGISERQVRRHLGALVKAGYIVQKNRGSRSNLYRTAFPAPGLTGHLRVAQPDVRCPVKPDAGGPPNPLREPSDEPSEGRPTAGQPTERRSTSKVSKGTRLDGASLQPRIFFVGMEAEHPELGGYTVTALYPLERKVGVRFHDSGADAKAGVRPEDAFADDGLDDTVPF